MWAFERDKKACLHTFRVHPVCIRPYTSIYPYITILTHNLHMSRYSKLCVSFLDIKRVLFSKNLEVILLSNIPWRLKSFVGTQQQRPNENPIVLWLISRLANRRIKKHAYYILAFIYWTIPLQERESSPQPISYPKISVTNAIGPV